MAAPNPFPYDAHLDKLLKAHTQKLGQEVGEMRLVETLASFLRRHTAVFGTMDKVERVQAIFKQQCELALKETSTSSASSSTTSSSSTSASTSSSTSTSSSGSGPTSSSSAASKSPQGSEAIEQPKAKTEAEKDQEEADDEEGEGVGEPPNADRGGSGPGYSWGQKLREVTVRVPLPAGARAKDLVVEVDSDAVCVRLARDEGAPLLRGEWCQPVRAESETWTLEDGATPNSRELLLTVQKRDQMSWWDCLLQGHPLINTRKIDPETSRPGDIEDPETRRMVVKMMADQRARAAGKPTSEEQEKLDALERFKRLHPELDFSQAKLM